jgi:hypothetical protein
VNREGARALLARLREAGEGLRARSWNELAGVLGRTGERFLDPSDPLRREAEERLPDEAGISAPMARVVAEGMGREWTRSRLRALVQADFADPEVLDGFRPGPEGSRLRALGPGLTLHVGAGTVPGVTATSLIRSLLVKSPALVKPGRGDRVLAELYLRGIREADRELARSAAVEYWPGGEGGSLEEEALRTAEMVVVYGGNQTVRTLRERLPPTTPLVAYRHRVSAGVVGRGTLGGGADAHDDPRTSGEGSARLIAREAALAVAMFDQKGCVSPQVVWIEEGGRVSPAAWAELLAQELDLLDRSLPSGPVDPDTASEIQQTRGAAEIRAAGGTADRVYSGAGGRWTVLYEDDPAFVPSCLGRTVRVKPLASLEDVVGHLAPFGDVLQTVALEAELVRRVRVAEGLARIGATRITTFRRQPWPPAWWRHDGKGPLEALVRWVSLEG